jgi:S-adenosylmethionine:tRNA ribosyltransferase-isomerase
MLVSDFDFDLPPELIAQEPASPRDHSRLLHLQRDGATVSHRHFYELPQLLRRGDLLVFNDTRVLRARLRGWKLNREDGQETRGARLEALLLNQRESDVWEALLKPSARLRPGATLLFASPDETTQMRATAVSRTDSGWLVRFEGNLRAALPTLGEVPLPPYIAPGAEEEKYQTVYARREAELESSAAPTAGLHFTSRTFDELRAREIETAFVTLQIGIGTFRPMQTETLDEHTMHRESYALSEQTAARINAQRARGGRVVAVGTTAVRVLESAANENGIVTAGEGDTQLFIRPGYTFRAVDALLTNFHLPCSSLLVMIAAFAGNDAVRYAYECAVAERYRFFSFGDAMFIG